MVIGQTGEQVDLVVIGGGPGGYSAAIRAAQLGRRALLVERDVIGGVCLNHGCIPSKALLSAARLVHRARGAAHMGIDATVSVDLARLQAWKQGVVSKLANGVRDLLERWGVRVVAGTARFAGERRIAVDDGAGVHFYEFGSAIVATGSAPSQRWSGALSPEMALALTALPERLVLLGGGYVAAEVATAFARLGSAVTLLSEERVLLPELEDEGLSRAVAGGLRRLSVTLHLSVTPADVTGSAVRFSSKDAAHAIEYDALVDAGPRTACTADLNLARAGVRVDADGCIAVDAQQRSNVHHIFAVGDVTPGPQLAHRAIAEGRVAAEAASGLPAAMDAQVVPLAYFTEPEVISAGLGADAARGRSDLIVARFPLGAAGRALTLDRAEGFVQVVAEAGSKRVLGVQIAGPDATELAGEAALAIEMTATLEDLALTLHPHPTIAEGIAEAADLALGRPRHIFRRADGER